MSLKENVFKTEPSALMYKLPIAHLIGLYGPTGVPVQSTQLETVCRQERKLLDVGKR